MADNYRQNDFGNIQREVMNRAKQMEQKFVFSEQESRKNNTKFQNLNQNMQNKSYNTSFKEKPNNSEYKSAPQSEHKQKKTDAKNKGFPDFMDIIMSDKERSLIILLIILLYEEGADSTLILALMYLII